MGLNLFEYATWTCLDQATSDYVPEDRQSDYQYGKLKSEMMKGDNTRYYLDLKENQRGRFLRVAQTEQQDGQRSQIAIPEQSLVEFLDTLSDLLDDEGQSGSRSLRVENKMFYFDVESNRGGVFLRVSEVRSNYRTSITIPDRSWGRFRDLLSGFA